MVFESNQGDPGGWTGRDRRTGGQETATVLSLPCETPLPTDNSTDIDLLSEGSSVGLNNWQGSEGSVWRPVISDIISPIDYQ